MKFLKREALARKREKLLLTKSLWTETRKESVNTKPLTGTEETDVAIIGGGYTGLSAAVHLREVGRAVVVLEAGEIGWGASGRNGGHVNPGWKVDPEDIIARYGRERGKCIVEMTGNTCDLVFDMIARYDIQCDPVRHGYIQGALCAKDFKTILKKAREWINCGAPVEILNKSRVCEILGTDRYIGGQLDLRGGHVQPLSYVCGLAHTALELGAVVHVHTPVIGVSREKNDWRIDTPGGIVRSKFVLVCTNAYTGSLWPKLSRVIVPVSSFITATEQLSEALCHQILPNKNQVSETRRIPIYFLLTQARHFVIGGRGNLFNTAQSGDTRHLQREAVRIYPQLTDVNWEFSWGGLVAVTVNRVPRLFELGQNAYAGMAYNGRGVPMGTMMGKQLAGLVCGEDVPMPLEHPRPIKFHQFRQVGISLHLLTGPIFDRIL